jgi:hypothetical protein
MDAIDLDQRFVELKERCAKLPAADRDRALDGFAQVLTLCELPREPDEDVSLSIGLSRPSKVTHKSG